MIDFFCKSMAASNFCDDRKSAFNYMYCFFSQLFENLCKIFEPTLTTTYYLLTGCKSRTVKYQGRDFEVRTELARSVCKKRGLSI